MRLLLEAVERLAPAPRPRATLDGAPRPVDAPFSALVFKVQANMDPRHRDRVAFLRVCSGRFERGMQRDQRPHRASRSRCPTSTTSSATSAWSSTRPTRATSSARSTRGELRVGDTLYDGPAVRFAPIPTLAPEHFATARNRDTSRHKQFHRGLQQLGEEGVVHVLRRGQGRDPAPVLAGVGPLQFEVAVERLEHEFGALVTARSGAVDRRPAHRRGGRGRRCAAAAWPTS